MNQNQSIADFRTQTSDPYTRAQNPEFEFVSQILKPKIPTSNKAFMYKAERWKQLKSIEMLLIRLYTGKPL